MSLFYWCWILARKPQKKFSIQKVYLSKSFLRKSGIGPLKKWERISQKVVIGPQKKWERISQKVMIGPQKKCNRTQRSYSKISQPYRFTHSKSENVRNIIIQNNLNHTDLSFQKIYNHTNLFIQKIGHYI